MKHPFLFKTVRLLPLSACLCAVLLSPQVFAEEQFKIGGQDVATLVKTEIKGPDSEILKILSADGFKPRRLMPNVRFVTPTTLESVVSEWKSTKDKTICKFFNQVYYADKFSADKSKMITMHLVFNGATGKIGKIFFTGDLCVLTGDPNNELKNISAFIAKYFPMQASAIWDQDKTSNAETVIQRINDGQFTKETEMKIKTSANGFYAAIGHRKSNDKWELIFENTANLKETSASGKSAWENSGIEAFAKENPTAKIVTPDKYLFYSPEDAPKAPITGEIASNAEQKSPSGSEAGNQVTNGGNSKNDDIKTDSYKPLGLGIGVVISGWDSPILAKLHDLGFFNQNDHNDDEFVFPSNYNEKLNLLKETMKKNVALKVAPPKYEFELSKIRLRRNVNNCAFDVTIDYYTRTGVIYGVELLGDLKVLCQNSGDQRATVYKIIENLFPYEQIWEWDISKTKNQEMQLKAKYRGAKEEEYNQFRDFFSPSSSDYINKIIAGSNNGFNLIRFRVKDPQKSLNVWLAGDDFRIQLTLNSEKLYYALLKDIKECKDAYDKDFTDAGLELLRQKAQKLGESATPANGF